MLNAFIYGVVLAFGLIIPLGVQNIFVFNQGATQRQLTHALPSVITASLCDTILIIIAVLGVSVIVLEIPWLKTAIFLIGFFFLLYMGWVTWRSKPAVALAGKPFSTKRQIGFALSVSLLNPHALLDSVAVIGTNSINFTGEAKFAFTLACVLVSWCWFFSLSVAGHYLNRFDKSGMGIKVVNKLSAFIIWGVAFYIGWQLLMPLWSAR